MDVQIVITPKTIVAVGGAVAGVWMGFKLLKANIEANYHAKMVDDLGSSAVRGTPKRSDSVRRRKAATEADHKPLPLDSELVTPLKRTNSFKRSESFKRTAPATPKAADVKKVSQVSNITVAAQPVVEFVDGNAATCHSAFAFSDIGFAYNLTPSNYLGEPARLWAEQGCDNCFGEEAKVVNVHTREGAAGIVHGALSEGVIATVYASSESLLHMIPSMHRISADQRPCVFHVSARTLDGDLSVSGDHSDLMAVRQTGFCMISSHSVQEAHDMAVVAHLMAMTAKLPVLHFMDGLRVLTEKSKVSLLDYPAMRELADKVQVKGSTTISAVQGIFDQLQGALGQKYKLFEYVGDEKAEMVAVILGSGSSVMEETANLFPGYKVGILKVRLFRPWSAQHLLDALPKTVKRVAVLDRCVAASGLPQPLFLDVAASFYSGNWSGKVPLVVGGCYGSNDFSPAMAKAVFDNLSMASPVADFTVGVVGDLSDKALPVGASVPSVPKKTTQVLVWGSDNEKSVSVIDSVVKVLAKEVNKFVQSYHVYDTYQAGGMGVVQSHIRFGETKIESHFQVESSDVVLIHNSSLLMMYDVLHTVKKGATVLLNCPWDAKALEKEMPGTLKKKIADYKIQLFTVDASKVASDAGGEDLVEVVLKTAVFNFMGMSDPNFAKGAILAEHTDDLDSSIFKVKCSAVDKAFAAIKKVDIPSGWQTSMPDMPTMPHLVAGSLMPPVHKKSADADDDVTLPRTIPSHLACWYMMFPEAFGLEKVPRPGVDHEVDIVEHRRLTPAQYDRNVAHYDFDTHGKFEYNGLGEALAVFGHNDVHEVEKFLSWYGLNGNDLVYTLSSRRDGGKEIMSVQQLFTQVLDIFGRPTKDFYSELAEFATEQKQKDRLLWLVSGEGAQAFKERVDETVSCFDVLQEFPSAHPPLSELIAMTPDIKPRLYSISSSGKAHPKNIHLLVVVHDWETPAGRLKEGLCSKYLSQCWPSAPPCKLGVGIRNSIMKLPDDPSVPIIMSGLGTGMAPFKAFIEERDFQRKQGMKIGPMALYFGARHRKEEFLYSDELEAFHAQGVLTHMGLAFSRDQKQKIYIQHKMQEDGKLLADWLLKKGGSFYLCGPTWPVPDIYAALISAFVQHGGLTEQQAKDKLDELKEQERYVLEVY
jgi:sulfite reductase (NADPH) flavoprotein alpha-component